MRTREGLPFGHPGCPVTGKQSGRFIDTGKTLRTGNGLQQLLIHEAAARVLGRAIGMVDREERSDQDAELISLRHQIAALEDEVAQLNAEVDGIDALARRGLVVRKAPGRPPKNKRPQD